MCGIIISTYNIPSNAHKFIKHRGPDLINKVSFNNFNFVHFLLHITGETTPQPIIRNNVACIFNGEIYNYKKISPTSTSDIFSILDAYQKYGEHFIQYLDGEFAIVLIDFNLHRMYITSDVFKTKPLFYTVNKDGIVISTYYSTCMSIKNDQYNSINPNEMLIFDIHTRSLIKKVSIVVFDLTQYKDTFDDYVQKFENAVLKRYPEHSIPVVSLSSGLDSGAIACCLHKYNKPALYISIPKNEDVKVLLDRMSILGKDNHIFIDLPDSEKPKWISFLNDHCEPFIWDWTYHPKLKSIKNGFTAGSMLGKCKIIYTSKAIDKNINVFYSGIGSDEIMARNQYYSNGYGNVDNFPSDLTTVFPWVNFWNGSMENYLKGDEYIGGCFGYETRYPFCDRDLVQEFLWLSPELKNTYMGHIYKPALLYYLHNENFPICYHKLGFNI